MDVIDHQPGGWFLLRDGAHHYLDVNVHQPMVGTSILLQLDADEETELILGRPFVEYLAARINYWSGQYQARNVTGPVAEEADRAIRRWLGSGRTGST